MNCEEPVTNHSDCEPSLSKGAKEKNKRSGNNSGGVKHYPGILEEGLVYSCAGPRADHE